MRRLAPLALLLPAAAPTAADAACPRAQTCVRITTSAGPIVVALETQRAPLTSANFLRYADTKRFDGTKFYRVARTKGAPKTGFIQGGIRKTYRLMLPPVAHEPTTKTGIRHTDGTISMARSEPGTATGDFFLTVGAYPSLDAKRAGKGDIAGYAAFGHVVSGMPVVKKILAGRTLPNAGAGPMRGQLLAEQVQIVSVRRER